MPSDDVPIHPQYMHPLDERGADAASKEPRVQLSDEPLGGDEEDRQPRPYQFSLLGLFGLMTVCGVYFFLERVHEGKFTIVMLGGMALVIVVLLPALWLLVWLMGIARDGSGTLGTLLFAVVLAGAVLVCLLQFWGM